MESNEGSIPKEIDPQATHIYLIRHVQTPWNSVRLQGTSNGEENHIRPERIVPHFTEIGLTELKDIDVIVTSDLDRSKESGEAAKAFGQWNHAQVVEEPDIRERNFGEYEAQTPAEIREMFLQMPWLVELYPDLPEREGQEVYSIFDEADIHPEGGETRGEVEARMRKALLSLRDRFPGKRILVISHGGAIASLRLDSKTVSHLTVSKSNTGENMIQGLVNNSG